MADKKDKQDIAPIASGVPAAVADWGAMVTAERPTGGDAAPEDRPIINREDTAMPRLQIAQKTSKEIEDGDPRRIEGLKFTEMFHTGDRRLYGNGPVTFCVLRVERPRYVQFRGIDEGGGVIDPDVPANDPRTQFTDGPDGEREKPVATKFLDFVILVLNGIDPADPLKNVMAISCKSKNLASAKQLNHRIGMRANKKLYLGVYRVTTERETNPKGAYGVYKFENAGWLTEGTPLERAAGEMWEALKHQVIHIEREAPTLDDTDFDPEVLERQSRQAAHVDM